MPLQNRVSPAGEIFVTTARGTFMGNRGGALHNENRRIVRQYASRRWIACLLEFKDRHRAVMSPGRYTELFFLDEAVALAAGHRPCAECRRERFNAFKEAWNRGGNPQEGDYLYADAIDFALHQARLDAQKKKRVYEASWRGLPDGCFIQMAGENYLVWGDALFRWSPSGYIDKHPRPRDATAAVLTPEPVVQCLRNGYRPEVHQATGPFSSKTPPVGPSSAIVAY